MRKQSYFAHYSTFFELVKSFLNLRQSSDRTRQRSVEILGSENKMAAPSQNLSNEDIGANCLEDTHANLQNDPLIGHLLSTKPEENFKPVNEIIHGDSELKSMMLLIF